ncbi:MAG: DNA recombination protein RmuC, partial [Methylobacter sp.]
FQADERLFSDAFEYKIVVVTPTTLLATLRTVENIWRYERRNENARAIADKAGIVYDKIRGFVDELDKLGKQLSTVNNTYDGVMNKLTLGHGNLIRHASSFVDLGVKVKKTFPKSITEQAGIETEEPRDEKLFRDSGN